MFVYLLWLTVSHHPGFCTCFSAAESFRNVAKSILQWQTCLIMRWPGHVCIYLGMPSAKIMWTTRKISSVEGTWKQCYPNPGHPDDASQRFTSCSSCSNLSNLLKLVDICWHLPSPSQARCVFAPGELEGEVRPAVVDWSLAAIQQVQRANPTRPSKPKLQVRALAMTQERRRELGELPDLLRRQSRGPFHCLNKNPLIDYILLLYIAILFRNVSNWFCNCHWFSFRTFVMACIYSQSLLCYHCPQKWPFLRSNLTVPDAPNRQDHFYEFRQGTDHSISLRFMLRYHMQGWTIWKLERLVRLWTCTWYRQRLQEAITIIDRPW